MSKQQQYDLFLPQALPSASLGHKRLVPTQGRPDLTTEDASTKAELDRVYDAWNTRIDKEVKAVAGGLKELVELADIGTNPAPNTHTLTTLHLKLKTSTLIRAAQTLRDTAHELRLALALGDDIATASRRDAEAARLKVETEALRREVTREFGLLVSRAPVGAAAAGGAAVADGGAGDGDGAKAGLAGDAEETGTAGAGAADAVAAPAAPAPAPVTDTHEDKMDVDDEDEDEFEEV